MILLNYLGTSFNQLTFERGFNFGKGTNYFVFILLPVCLALSKGLNIVGIARKMEKAREAKASKVKEEEITETKKDK